MNINNDRNQCQCAHVIRDNADNNVIPSQRRQQCNSEPTMTTPKSRDNDDNNNVTPQDKEKRTREQEINDTYILKQQIERKNSLLAQDSSCGIYEKDDDDDSNNNEYNNKTQDAAYYEEEDDDEYNEFDSDNNKRRISRSDAMACTYHVVCQGYEAKGWEHNNRWIEYSVGLPMTEDWDDTFKE